MRDTCDVVPIGEAEVRSTSPTIWWIRRDVRLHDNRALAAAQARGGAVIPVFVRDPALLESRLHREATRRQAFLAAGLHELDGALRARGARLVVRSGRPPDVLAALVRASGAQAVVAEADASPYARRRDAAVRRAVPLELAGSTSVHPPSDVVKSDGTPYTVFTPFRKAWLARPLPTARDLLPAPERLAPVPDAITSEDWPRGETPAEFPPGEAEGLRRLRAFADGARATIHRYGAERDRVDRARHVGAVAVPRASAWCRRARRWWPRSRPAPDATVRRPAAAPTCGSASSCGASSTWRSSSIIRASCATRSTRASAGSTTAARRAIWRRGSDGRTGFPIVDAAMRQLARDRLDAQPRPHDRRVVPDQGPAARLARRRSVVHATAARRRPGGEQRRLAMDGRRRHGRRTVLPRLQPGAAGEEVRPRRRLRAPLGARAGARAAARAARAVDADAARAAGGRVHHRVRLSRAHRRSITLARERALAAYRDVQTEAT